MATKIDDSSEVNLKLTVENPQNTNREVTKNCCCAIVQCF